MSYIRQKCKDCGEEKETAFGIVGTTEKAVHPPIVCQKCKSENVVTERYSTLDVPTEPMRYARAIEKLYPWIPWTEPVHVDVPPLGEGYACRYCVAARGLKPEDLMTEENARQHIKVEHL